MTANTMTRLLIFLLLFFALGTAAHASKYTCADFIVDLHKSKADNSNDLVLPSSFHIVKGFLLGAFYSARRQEFTDTADPDFAEYEDDVISECSKRPATRTTVVALELSADLQSPKSPQKHTRSSEDWSPEEAAKKIAFIDWGAAHCGKIPNGLVLLALQPIRSGLDPELLQTKKKQLRQLVEAEEVRKVELCKTYSLFLLQSSR